tara:strand:+ start:964 stop:1287 length:324 start_codon:yes stop_codon:yes gene_type:complete
MSSFVNDTPEYEEILRKKDLNYITQYETPILTHLQDEDYPLLNFIPHIWQTGDKYYKLAGQYYKNPSLWWVIAWINKKPTESHVKMGETIYITLSLEQTMALINYTY